MLRCLLPILCVWTGFCQFAAVSNVSDAAGFTMFSTVPSDQSGRTVRYAGDINNDGIDDIVIGAYFAVGRVYVVFGSSTPWDSSVSLNTLNGTNGCELIGPAPDALTGWSVDRAGDVNGDGIDDLMIGAYLRGDVYIVFGRAGDWPRSIALKNLTGTDGFRLYAYETYPFGYALTYAGDVSGDGIDDIVIGGGPWNSGGYTFVVYGSKSPWPASIYMGQSSSYGYMIFGIDPYEESGDTLSAGDVNGDGINDIIIAANNFDSNRGKVYVVFGSSRQGDLWLNTLNGTNGFTIFGMVRGDRLGNRLCSADINNDGYADIIMTAYGIDYLNTPFQVFIVFGRPGEWANATFLQALNGVNGFVIKGSLFGDPNLGAGDVNNDHIPDLIINDEVNGTIKTAVVFGWTGGWSHPFLLSSLDGTNGFVLHDIIPDISNASSSGVAVADLNHDGIGDIVIGNYAFHSNSGKTTVVFGTNKTLSRAPSVAPTSKAPSQPSPPSSPSPSSNSVPEISDAFSMLLSTTHWTVFVWIGVAFLGQ